MGSMPPTRSARIFPASLQGHQPIKRSGCCWVARSPQSSDLSVPCEGGGACDMSISRCPHCLAKLGNFLYADDCPHCHTELKHNTRILVLKPKRDPLAPKSWPGRMFTRLTQFVDN